MSLRGRILFSSGTLALLLSGWPSLSLATDMDRSCHSRIFESVLGINPHTRLVKDLRAYNRMIQRPVSEFGDTALPEAFQEALEHFSPVSSSFPSDAFLAWYRRHPLSPQQWQQAVKSNELEQPTTYRRAFKGFFNGFSKDYWAYIRLSPVIDLSYQGVHLLYEKAQGKEVDLDPSKMALQLGS